MSLDDYAPTIIAAAQKYGVPKELLRAEIQHESNGDPLAIGDGGRALGLMQVHLVAAEDVGKETQWGQLHEAVNQGDKQAAAELSIDIGTAYLAKMLKQFGNDYRWALAAYNQGPTVIQRGLDYAKAVLAIVGTV
jgi:soluble lytic murein transglycosylase-like protein